MRRSISQALSDKAIQRAISTGNIINAQPQRGLSSESHLDAVNAAAVRANRPFGHTLIRDMRTPLPHRGSVSRPKQGSP